MSNDKLAATFANPAAVELERMAERLWHAEAERDRARGTAALLEAEVAQVREMHYEERDARTAWCAECYRVWPCPTLSAVNAEAGEPR